VGSDEMGDCLNLDPWWDELAYRGRAGHARRARDIHAAKFRQHNPVRLADPVPLLAGTVALRLRVEPPGGDMRPAGEVV
jgi:hypothetical protein